LIHQGLGRLHSGKKLSPELNLRSGLL